MDNIEFIFSEFSSAFKPNRENVLKYFPDARITEYNEVNAPILFSGDRRLYHMGDYQDWQGILKSKADIAIAFDADLYIVSQKVTTIVPLVRKFGFCVAASGRFTVEKDTRIGTDSDGILDETRGAGYAMCNAFIAVDPKDPGVRRLFETACRMMQEKPLRGPLVLWRAIWETGVYPYLLPQQWCVCEDLKGIGNEIILHGGDKSIREHYGISAC